MDHQTFRDQIDALAGDFQLVVLDLPNHGESPKFSDKLPYSKTCAKIAVGLLQELGIEKAIFVGQSLGSFIVSQAALMYPEKVTATVHIGGGGLYPKVSGLIKALNPLVGPVLYLIPEQRIYRLFAQHKALKKETQVYLEQTAARTGRKLIAHLTREMIKDMSEGVAGPVEQPTLITYGDHEAGFVKKMNERFHHSLKNSSLRIISEAHHIANQDNPQEFNQELKIFIEEWCS